MMILLAIVSVPTLLFGVLWLRAANRRDIYRTLWLEAEESTCDARKERDEWQYTAAIYHQQARDFHEQLNDALQEQQQDEIHEMLCECLEDQDIHETHGRN